MNKKIISVISLTVLISSCGISLTNKWNFATKDTFEKTYCSRSTEAGEKECVCIINKVQTRYPDPIDFFAFESDTTKRADFLKYFRDDVAKGCVSEK